jgi:Flp pilus assembly protein TadG
MMNARRMTRRAQRGATTVEMTLVGIPLVFMLISIFEISRGMWMYETAATAVREGVRFASVHGANCVLGPEVPNQCDITANDVVRVIRAGAGTGSTHGLDYGPTGAGGAGLPEETTLVRFTSLPSGASLTCKLDGTSGGPCSSQWPPTGDNGVKNVITISIHAPFSSALSMFWPGSKPINFAVVNLWASSSDTIQF